VKWAELWSNLEKSVKPNKAAYDRFTDYIPPYKNLGAIFIQAYRKQMRDTKEKFIRWGLF
jgi:hypothetical protein